MTDRSRNKLIIDFCFSLAGLLLSGYVGYKMLSLMNNDSEKSELKQRRKKLFSRLGIPNLSLDPYEEIVGSEIMVPDDIQEDFEDVGGYEEEIRTIQNLLLEPLQLASSKNGLFECELLAPPKGVLLCGPPGCGKTMLAKCVAKRCKARFINVQCSTLMNKYFGESEKLIRALFTLASKIKPCIIFIDEIDALLKDRKYEMHESFGCVKAELLAQWDGLLSEKYAGQVVMMGATNRLDVIDSAFLRRLPLKIPVEKPDERQRRLILQKLFDKAPEWIEFVGRERTLDTLAECTDGYTGSSLKDLVKFTLMDVANPVTKQHSPPSPPLSSPVPDCRSIVYARLDDFWATIERYSEWSNIY